MNQSMVVSDSVSLLFLVKHIQNAYKNTIYYDYRIIIMSIELSVVDLI